MGTARSLTVSSVNVHVYTCVDVGIGMSSVNQRRLSGAPLLDAIACLFGTKCTANRCRPQVRFSGRKNNNDSTAYEGPRGRYSA